MMSIKSIGSPIDITTSALHAQSMRMNVYSNNLANASTAKTDTGGPYRRKEVILSSVTDALNGVKIDRVAEDFTTEFQRIHNPGHPQADADGYVLMPNVSIPIEMMNLTSASRAYQANTAVLKRYQEMVDATLQLLR
jgi:flagellar basal-body rod protein FlgC